MCSICATTPSATNRAFVADLILFKFKFPCAAACSPSLLFESIVMDRVNSSPHSTVFNRTMIFSIFIYVVPIHFYVQLVSIQLCSCNTKIRFNEPQRMNGKKAKTNSHSDFITAFSLFDHPLHSPRREQREREKEFHFLIN